MIFIIGVAFGYFIHNLIFKYKFKKKYIKECQDVENALDKFFEEY